ncbi:MAG: FkbM family methyltransferase [Leptolyngbyaceae cyanobacterium bins.302]|nr:FkbM family methyltransferase [Leptolyngbyaceae cyanobacterium bins.302]
MGFFVPYLRQNGHLDHLHTTVCLVGSRKLLEEDDYGNAGWSVLAPNLTIYGVDADADACYEANANIQARQVSWEEEHFPIALGKQSEETTLYVTDHPACTSLYPPNIPFANRLFGFEKSMQLSLTIEIEVTTLDEFYALADLKEIDFLQIDVQGADLDVLQGATNLLQQSILGVQIEVEFSSLYVNQPLFTNIDLYLRQQGFTLFDLITTNPWCRVPRSCLPIQSSTRAGQLVWADACYLRDPLGDGVPWFAQQNPNKMLKLACIADILNFPDFAFEVLVHLASTHRNNPTYNTTSTLVEALSEGLKMSEQDIKNISSLAKLQ